MISVKGICRGNQKIYLNLVIKDLNIESELNAYAAIPNVDSVRCSVLAKSGDHSQWVLTIPDLGISDLPVDIIATLPDGLTERVRLHIDSEKAKWQSRFNYKINKALCAEIRNFDDSDRLNRASVSYWEAIEDGEDLILRLSVRTPYRSDSDISIKCIKKGGSAIPICVYPFGQEESASSFSDEKHFLSSQFSVRMPNIEDTYFFIVSDSNHPAFNSFESLELPQLRELKSNTNQLMRHAQFDPGYPYWFENHKGTDSILFKQQKIEFGYKPKFSIIVPLYKTPIGLFKEMVNSVLDQSYKNWELILVNSTPECFELTNAVSEVSALYPQIIVVTLERNLGISENTNQGIDVATGDFVCFFDHDDVLEPDVLFSYAEALNKYDDIDLLYCDEDKLLPDGTLSQPFLKPDFNIDLLRNNNYICHMLTIRRSLLDSVPRNTSEYDGAQDHNLTLRIVEKARRVYHVDKVLYHWRISESSTAANADTKPYASNAGIRAVQDHLNRMGIKATVSLSRRPFTYKVIYEVPEDYPLVSIIIPNKDHIDLLDACLKSIFDKTSYSNYEIVIIENNSTNPSTFKYYSQLQDKHPNTVKVITWEHEFNFSKLMNFGEKHSAGEYLLLLNNDTEIITPNWIDVMLGLCSRNDVGAVGAKLYYPDDTIQHAGVVINARCAGHLHRNYPRDNWGYFALNDAQQDLSAVTAACMMTKRSIFNSVGGFTEDLQVAFNDIDYCLKIREIGKLVVYTPEVELYHYESVSRGAEIGSEKKIRFHREISYMNYRWAKYYVDGDPCYNNNFSQGEPFNLYYHL